MLLSVGLEHEPIEGCLFSLLCLFNPSSLHNAASDVFPLVSHCCSNVKACTSLCSEIIVQVVHQVLSSLPEPSVQRSVSEGQKVVVSYELNPGIQNFMQDIELTKLTEYLCYKGQGSTKKSTFILYPERQRKEANAHHWCGVVFSLLASQPSVAISNSLGKCSGTTAGLFWHPITMN